MQPVPYCGTPPVPGVVAWNLDPVLVGILLVVALCWTMFASRADIPRTRRLAFLSGWLILSASLISPLCNLSIALFSARIGQHMLIEFFAAPLIALGLWWGTPSRKDALQTALCSAVIFAAALWFWHMPGPYQWTFRSEAAYWTMHVTLIAASVLLWHSLLDSGSPSASLLASGVTTLQMTVLGAVYTFAARPLLTVYLGTTDVWGLTTIEDQQFGGLLMWIPPGLALTAIAVWTMAAMLSPQERTPIPTSYRAPQDQLR